MQGATHCTAIGVIMAILTLRPIQSVLKDKETRMWADAQRDGCPAKHRWRPLLNAAKFG